LHEIRAIFVDAYTSIRVFYWIGARYDTSLLIQASIMVVVQAVLLYVALRGRPQMNAASHLSHPFAGSREGDTHVSRPLNFWQWRSPRPYWLTLAYYAGGLLLLQMLIGTPSWYVTLQGYVALGIEAGLPIPQILSNQRNQSCKGFRLSVLVNWLVGDVFKMSFFFLAESSIPWAFKLCGLFQACCDAYLGVQYYMYGEGKTSTLNRDPFDKDDIRLH